MSTATLSPAAAIAAHYLPAATDDQHQATIAALTESGHAVWVFDPYVPGVLALVRSDTTVPLAVLFTDEPELEVGVEFGEMADALGV